MSKSDESCELEFDVLSELCSDINLRLNNSIFVNKSRMKEEKMKEEMKIRKTFDFFEEKIHPQQGETSFFDDEKENISD